MRPEARNRPSQAEWELYRALMARMKGWCASRTPRCELRVAVIPTRQDVAATGQGRTVPVTARVLGICAELGLPALDLAPGLYGAWLATPQRAADLTPLYFAHDGHWDNAGHAAAAAILRDAWTWDRPVP